VANKEFKRLNRKSRKGGKKKSLVNNSRKREKGRNNSKVEIEMKRKRSRKEADAKKRVK